MSHYLFCIAMMIVIFVVLFLLCVVLILIRRMVLNDKQMSLSVMTKFNPGVLVE